MYGPALVFLGASVKVNSVFTSARHDSVSTGDLTRILVRAINGEVIESTISPQVWMGTPRHRTMRWWRECNWKPILIQMCENWSQTMSPDPSRTEADSGIIEFVSIQQTAQAGVKCYYEYGVTGGFTHLEHK